MACRIDVANTVSMGTDLWAPIDLKLDAPKRDSRLDRACLDALIIEGIGDRKCPLVSGWAAFVVAGAVIASKTGCFIAPPDSRPADFSANLSRYLWQAIYEAIAEGEGDPFLSVMAHSFIPVLHHPAPDSPYFASCFEEYWEGIRYEAFASVGKLSNKYLGRRNAVFVMIGTEVAEEVVRVAQYVPTMTEIALSEMTGYRY